MIGLYTMKNIGYVVIAAGFLGGAVAAVADKDEVGWAYFIPAVAAAAAGVLMVRLAHKTHSTSQKKLASNMEAVRTSLARITANIADLDGCKAEVETHDVRRRIDELFAGDLERFVEARESIVHVYGLQAYADVMSPFAAGERYLNRVWSASADGYVDEVNEYLGRATEQFADSLAVLRKLGEPRP